MPDQALESPAPATCPARRFSPVRLWLAGMGVLSVGVGALGVFVPGLPTTIFLILGSWCFARSCPWLEERLIRNRLFRPFLCFLEPGTPMPTRARVVSTAMLWVAVSISVLLMLGRGAAGWIPITIALSGVIGTVFVWRFARPQADPTPVPESVASR
ncbi:MAG: YbaN family protein [Phycisphaerales bacterium]|nr:YbaN family protein [Phycisphaerales bacterium]